MIECAIALKHDLDQADTSIERNTEIDFVINQILKLTVVIMGQVIGYGHRGNIFWNCYDQSRFKILSAAE